MTKPSADKGAARSSAESEPVELTSDLSDLSSDEREARRKALKTMLSSNEQRQQAALRKRRPPMALGDRISIVSSEFHGKQAHVLDADFIHSRVLLKIDEVAEPLWLPFKNVTAI